MNTSPRYANTSPRFANTSPRFPFNGDSSDQISSPTAEVEAQQRLALVEWLNSIVPHFYLSVKATEDELRSSLLDGIVLCEILNKLKPGTVDEGGDSSPSSDSRRYRISRFIASVNEMGLPSFLMSDLEKGPMKPVLDCLLAFKDRSMPNFGGLISKAGEDRRKELSDTKFQRALHPSVPSESPAAVLLGGNKFHEVFQLKQGLYADLPAMKLSEMMKSNSLDNAPTQSLLSVINGILDESIERKNAEIPQRVACLLRKVVQEIERRIATQAEHLRTQSNLFKAREEKYQSRIRVLEALAKGTSEESEIAMNQLQHMKFEKSKMEEKKKHEEEEVTKLKRQKDESSLEVSTLKQELEMAKKANQEFAKFKKQTDESGTELSTLKQELEMAKKANEEFVKLKKQTDERGVELSTLKQELEMAKKATQEVEKLKKQKDESSLEVLTLKQELEMAKKAHEEIAKLKRQKDESGFEVSMLKQELEMAKKTHEQHFLELEKQAKLVRSDLEQRLKEQNQLLEYSKKRIKEVEENSESKCHSLSKKAHVYESFIDTQFTALQELRHSSEVLKRDILKSQKSYLEEMNKLGQKLKKMAEAAQKYHEVLSENRKIYNELQDLKGNIRVYCRIRPFLPGESETQTVVEHIGEHGELVITNSSNRGMDGQKPFKFNKVYGPTATQAKVFADTQPLIRTVLDGYNVCIFAYGQTGSGKTHTMSGPDNATKEEWGVNYRALDDLFHISEDRKSYFLYEIAIQMIEIYNEQVRDLLSTDGSAKKLGILATTQPHGLAVPDASMLPVQSTSDVIELMNIGLTNRAVGSTAMNVRSSRSHSIVTIHVRGKDLKTGSTSQGNLHLVDLAGSERVDRSEAVGDRLREAQHINKSLSALGDVIFALAQKSSHVPYRNSKLTQVLQTSLGGRAKTLMFVQINPDVTSNSETLSTLKFAERVSGVELGAARSNKEGRDVKELMEQVASLKDTIAKKDEEIERLQVLKDHPKNVSILKRNSSWQRNGTSPTSAGTLGSPRSPTPRSPSSSSKRSPLSQKTTLDHENSTEYSHTDDIEHKNGSLRSSRSMNDLMQQRQYKLAEEERSVSVDDDFLGLDDADNEEKSSEISDGDLSIRTDPDGVLEEKLSPKSSKRSENTEKRIGKSKTGSKLLASPRTSTPTTPSRLSQVRTAMRTTSALKKPSSGSSSPVTPARRRL